MAEPGDMLAKIIAGVQAKTGRDFEAWARVVNESGPAVRKDRVAWLMQTHGLGRTAANLIADIAAGKPKDYGDQKGMLEGMYAGAKAGLRPIYERLVDLGKGLGPEFSMYQCAGQTTFRRNRQFAWVKPATKTRVDLGLALPGYVAGGRLLAVTGTNDKDRIRLRIALSRPEEIDAEVQAWMRQAWDLEAGTGSLGK